MSTNERLQALKALVQVLDNRASLAQCLPASAAPMTKELCFGVCRHYVRLSCIATLLLDKKPKDIEVWVAIVLGLYQIHYMQLPDYAVVKETVGLLEKSKKKWAKGLVNAVLRTFCRQQQTLIASLQNDDAFIHGHPDLLLKTIQQAWPDDWPAIVAANDVHPPMTLRVNLSRISREDYLLALAAEDLEAVAHPLVPSALTLMMPCDVRTLPGFAKGWISVQDAAAQCAASLLQLRPGLRVLDACCAPGGKTAHLLETEPSLATCLALDVDAWRLQRVEENLQRLNLQATVIQGDALVPDTWWDKQLFDRILLDAPCSATGVIRRHADIKLRRTAEDIQTVVQMQHAMLCSLWPLLASGGLMVYATCSIMPAENEAQISAFQKTHPDCCIESIHADWGRATEHGRQILPGEDGMDGFFYSVLRKKESSPL
ncbi:MAG: 16S rRNA (cytosine(967)-C(5))-methyltransferase [Legionella sp.]|nr:MAG: 16S rRNA (cytosine(967)-C(5))-methyltransferase [Legionella sp.]PJD98362.1 MAG: 16S rRNA (cytosine(967)-C(5))-methyltransferase [Legionella sp.]